MTSFVILLGFFSTFLVPFSVSANGTDISNIATGFITTLLPIWIPVAVIAIVIAGFTLSISREEGAMDKARSQIILVVIGGMIITVLLTIGPTTFIGKFYNGTINNTNAILSAPNFIEFETIGIAEWIITIIAAIGILMIILSLLEAVTSLGDEGAYTKVRTAVLNVTIGLMIIVAAKVIRTTFFPLNGGVANPAPLMLYVMGKITIILNFILVIAVAIIIYAGFRMVASFGNEDDYNNAKSLVFRVLTGILVLLVSYSLVQIVIRIFS